MMQTARDCERKQEHPVSSGRGVTSPDAGCAHRPGSEGNSDLRRQTLIGQPSHSPLNVQDSASVDISDDQCSRLPTQRPTQRSDVSGSASMRESVLGLIRPVRGL